ncbi:MAG: hypothetical protein HC854_04745 [Flavobacterium sp.]|nr:hypothetical protein [Flavobacterium sp.]
MKNSIIIVILFFIGNIVNAQIEITGKVFDEKNEPFPMVSIYVNGTTIGTTSDFEGKFYLRIPSSLNAYLVVNHVGYKPQYFKIEDKSFDLKVTLLEERIELKEVTMQKDLFSRSELLILFKEYFLGVTPAGLGCQIMNEDDLYFNYDEEYFTMKAFSDKPLLIENKYLGYKIEYTLLEFECQLNRLSVNPKNVSRSFYGGTSVFTDVNPSQANLIKRELSYKGSTLHLFRNILQNKWSKEEFLLFGEAYILNPNDYFKISGNTITVTEYKKKTAKKSQVAEF